MNDEKKREEVHRLRVELEAAAHRTETQTRTWTGAPNGQRAGMRRHGGRALRQHADPT